MATEKKSVDPSEPTMAEVLAKMAAIMEAQAGIQQKGEEREAREDLSTVEARKAGRSLSATGAYENRLPPEISALNPLGERDHPRPDLKCRMVWVGFLLSKSVLSREEIELLNQTEPGDYRVTKADQSKIDLTITQKKDRAGKLDVMTYHFPCKSTEERHNHMPMTSYLREILEQHAATLKG